METTNHQTTGRRTAHNLPELLPIPTASRVLGVQYRQLLQAVNDGRVPYYRLGSSRRLVKVSEVLSTMRELGGDNV